MFCTNLKKHFNIFNFVSIIKLNLSIELMYCNILTYIETFRNISSILFKYRMRIYREKKKMGYIYKWNILYVYICIRSQVL